MVVDGVEYEVDCMIFATGFEVGTAFTRRAGFEIYGRDGVRLTDHWAKGMRTLHGLQPRLPQLLLPRLHPIRGLPQLHPHRRGAGPALRLSGSAVGAAGRDDHRGDAGSRGRLVGDDERVDGQTEGVLRGLHPELPLLRRRSDNPHGMLSTNFGGKPVEFFDMLAQWRSTGRLDGVMLR